MLAAKPHDLSSIPETPKVERELTPTSCPLTCILMLSNTHVLTNIGNKKIKDIRKMFKTILKKKIPRTPAQCGIIKLAILNQASQYYAHVTSHSQIVWVQKNILQTHLPK